MSNLPPGVSVSDIPGNRPEDERYEVFWTEVIKKGDELGLSPEHYWEEDDPLTDLIDWVASKCYTDGYTDAVADMQLEQFLAEQEKQNE